MVKGNLLSVSVRSFFVLVGVAAVLGLPGVAYATAPLPPEVPDEGSFSNSCDDDGDCTNEATCINEVCYVPKNRYISFTPGDNGTTNVAFQVELTASEYFPDSQGVLGWVGVPFEAVDDDSVWVSRVVEDPVYRVWDESIIKVGDCETVPVATYEISATFDGSVFSDPLELPTIPKPGAKYWGDVVGAKPGGAWTPPNGVVNMDDVSAVLERFQYHLIPPTSWVDLCPGVPDTAVNMADVQCVVWCYQGNVYPFGAPAHIAEVTTATPDHEESLWRTENNIVRLTFDHDIVVHGTEYIKIQELLTGGSFGSDVSGSFSFTVEDDDQDRPRILKILETATGGVLDHRTWYAIRHEDNWCGVAPFELHFVVQRGDANNDGRVMFNDLSYINTGNPTDPADDDDRRDIDGDGNIDDDDVTTANGYIPSDTVSKPSGH